MNKTMRATLAFALLGLANFIQAAEVPNPALQAHINGIRADGKQSDSLRIAELNIEMTVVGAVAETTITARFDNPSDYVLEGDFKLALPEGAVVSGYALDIDNRMIDGVLLEPTKAERVFEERVRQGIDPGVATVSRGNEFSTRVFPIFANKGRTIRVKFAAPIHPERGFSLPLGTVDSVERTAFSLRAERLKAQPALELPEGLQAYWSEERGAFVAHAVARRQMLGGRLSIAPVRPVQRALLTKYRNAGQFVQVLDQADSVRVKKAQGQRLRIYWDRSLSRADDALDREMQLLEDYLAQSKPSSIDVVAFNSSGAKVERAANAMAVRELLGRSVYRGATSYAVLEDLDAPDADVCLVFSDGVSTIDARPDFTPGCEVFAISSAPDADAGFLARIAGGSMTAVLRLDKQPAAQLLARLQGGAPRVVEVRDAGGRKLKFVSLDAGARGWAVIVETRAEAPAEGEVVLRVAGIGRGLTDKRYTPAPLRQESFHGSAAMWASDRVAMLAAQDDQHEALVALSRKFSVASTALSFIVLETPQDYAQAQVEPPSNYPKEELAEYREALAAWQQDRDAERAGRLDRVIAAWEEQKTWWNTRFERRPKQQIAREKSALAASSRLRQAPAEMQAPAPVTAVTEEEIVYSDAGPADLVVVTGMRRSLKTALEMKRDAVGLVDANNKPIDVELEAWNPDRPYLKALDAAKPSDYEKVFAREATEHGALPAFYFDVAEWLFRRDRKPEATEMLLSALELPVCNEETLSMVADRLARYGGINRAVWLNERVHMLLADLPQPRRTLALTLAKRAASNSRTARSDLRRAVELLNDVIVTPWDDRYEGIELIALMDANALLPKLRGAGETAIPLDKRLQALLDVDLRVVIQWNTAATDMDLWVDQPDAERAIFNHPKTEIGGRLSNDMTSGYGPEEYLLRRAIPGVYEIRVNVYASDRINPNGTTVITAHLFRDFGRPTQKEETIELELKPGEAGEQLVGKFTVGG